VGTPHDRPFGGEVDERTRGPLELDQLGAPAPGSPAVAFVVADGQRSIKVDAHHLVRVGGVDGEVEELGFACPRLPGVAAVVTDHHSRRGRVRSIRSPLGDDERVEVGTAEKRTGVHVDPSSLWTRAEQRRLASTPKVLTG